MPAMNLPEFENYTDEKLEAARVAIAAVQEQRQRLAVIPSQIANLAKSYVDGGGDVADLSVHVTTDASPAVDPPVIEDPDETPEDDEPEDDETDPS